MPDSGSDSQSDSGSDVERSPEATPQEIGAKLLEFYRFLTTLHYKPEDLKVPPPEGWPSISPEACGHFRSDYAIEVLRHLPYLTGDTQLHYKSKVLDYTAFSPQDFARRHQDDDEEEWWSTEGIVPAGDMVCLAAGYEDHGREFFLNVVECEVSEVLLRASDVGPVGLDQWISTMKESYRNLVLVPCPGRVTLDCYHTRMRGEREPRITEEEFRAQTEDWGTETDIHFVRQVYRDCGWPNAFRRDEAMTYLQPLLESIADENDDRWWQESDAENACR